MSAWQLHALDWDPLQIMLEELQFAKALGVRLNGWRLGSRALIKLHERALIKLHEHYNCPAASLDMSGNFSSILGLEVFLAEDPWTVSGVYDD